MKYVSVILLVLLTIPAEAQAQELQLLKPHPASQSVLYGGAAFDLGTTWAGIRYGRLKEGNPIAGQGKVQQAGLVIGVAVVTDLITRRIGRTHPRLATFTNFFAGGLHIAAGAWNLSRDPRR